MGDRVVIDGGEVSLTSQIDGGDVALTTTYDGGEIGQMYVPLPLISIGEVETLPPGSEATATMTGTASRPGSAGPGDSEKLSAFRRALPFPALQPDAADTGTAALSDGAYASGTAAFSSAFAFRKP